MMRCRHTKAARNARRSCCSYEGRKTAENLLARSVIVRTLPARSTGPLRLAVRTRPFHGCNRSSILLGVATCRGTQKSRVRQRGADHEDLADVLSGEQADECSGERVEH